MKAWILLDHSCQTLPGFCSMKQLGVFLLLLDGMLVHCRSFPCNLLGFPNNFLVPIYTPGWREALWELSVLPKNTTQCPRPGLEPGPRALGMSALTMRPPYLPQLVSYDCNIRQINTKPEVNYFITFVFLFLVTGNSAFEIADSIMGATNLIHMFARLVIF